MSVDVHVSRCTCLSTYFASSTTLDKESAKLFCLSAVEGIRFADLGSRQQLISSAGVVSQQTYRTHEIVKDDEGGVCVGWEDIVIKVVIIEVGVVRIVPRIITGTFVTRRTTCRGDWLMPRLAGLKDAQGSRTEQNCDER